MLALICMLIAAGALVIFIPHTFGSVTDPSKGPFPYGLQEVILSSYMETGLTGVRTDVWVAPYDCFVRKARCLGSTRGANAVANITVRTIEGTPQTVMTALTPTNNADTAGVIALPNLRIGAGDALEVIATTGASSPATVRVRLYVEPASQRVAS